MDVNGVNANSKIETEVELKDDNFVIESPGMINSNIELELNSQVLKKEHIHVIDDITINDEMIEDPYSMVIYFVKPEDTLWKIAKQFRSTPEDIAKINEIEDERKLLTGKQLFIPRYHFKVSV